MPIAEAEGAGADRHASPARRGGRRLDSRREQKKTARARGAGLAPFWERQTTLLSRAQRARRRVEHGDDLVTKRLDRTDGRNRNQSQKHCVLGHRSALLILQKRNKHLSSLR